MAFNAKYIATNAEYIAANANYMKAMNLGEYLGLSEQVNSATQSLPTLSCLKSILDGKRLSC